MRLLILNTSDLNGGAARATHRNHNAVLRQNVDSTLMVVNKSSSEESIVRACTRWDQVLYKFKNKLVNLFLKIFFSTKNTTLHSPAIFNSKIVKKINSSNFDLVHLQWINSEMLSIRDISNLNKSVVWTLHDMWAFCGAEHYTEDFRWKFGYQKNNRPLGEVGFDLNRWTWNRKLRYWKRPIHIVTPSNWLAECAKSSLLMKDWPITVIPNGIDIENWKAIDKKAARQRLGLPLNASLLLFGAMGGAADPRKGFDLLEEALVLIKKNIPLLELVIFGQSAPKTPVDLGFPVHYIGHLNDDEDLNVLYSSADALVIPSRQDNLPNTGVEALASGTPLIAFNEGGLPDLIKHKSNGYLAKAFDVQDLARGIMWLFEDPDRLRELSIQSRLEAVERFSYSVVGEMYLDLYRNILAKEAMKL